MNYSNYSPSTYSNYNTSYVGQQPSVQVQSSTIQVQKSPHESDIRFSQTLGGGTSYVSQPLVQSSQFQVQKSPHESDIKFSQSLGAGLTDAAGAKAVAKRLMEIYDRDRDGNINNIEVVPMMVDAYQTLNRRFQPNKQDIDSFFRVFDRNKDGRINYEDVEAMCMKYLTTSYMKEELGGYR